MTSKVKRSKKGLNPIRARLRETTSGSAPLTNGAKTDPSSASHPSDHASSSPFQAIHQGPLLTLLFDSSARQHAALARIETFYEAPAAKGGGRYLDWSSIHQGSLQLCRGYEAFNFPCRAAQQWLKCMYEQEVVTENNRKSGEAGEDLGGNEASTGGTRDEQEDPSQGTSSAGGRDQPESAPWYRRYCNAEETYLLEHLTSLGAVDALLSGTSAPVADENDAAGAPTSTASPLYIISSLASRSSSTLPHERFHALHHLSETYRRTVSSHWSQLSTKAQNVIQHDLALRGYDPCVYLDEWQAYLLGEVALGPHPRGEALWGSRVKEELTPLVGELVACAKREAEQVLPGIHLWK